MPELLAVTKSLIEQLQKHIAYCFWSPIVQNFPITHIPLEHRKFYKRSVTVEKGGIYLTTEAKFVYCNGEALSYLYPDQDFSFHFHVEDGLLINKDGYQFSALLGQVAIVTGYYECRLVNCDKTFHPFFDQFFPIQHTLATQTIRFEEVIPAILPESSKNSTKGEQISPPTHNGHISLDTIDMASLVAQYPEEMTKEIYHFRVRSRKSYAYLAKKYQIPETDVMIIVRYWRRKMLQETTEKLNLLKTMPISVRDQIYHLKYVSRRSYEYIAKSLDLPLLVVKKVCADYRQKNRSSKKAVKNS